MSLLNPPRPQLASPIFPRTSLKSQVALRERGLSLSVMGTRPPSPEKRNAEGPTPGAAAAGLAQGGPDSSQAKRFISLPRCDADRGPKPRLHGRSQPGPTSSHSTGPFSRTPHLPTPPPLYATPTYPAPGPPTPARHHRLHFLPLCPAAAHLSASLPYLTALPRPNGLAPAPQGGGPGACRAHLPSSQARGARFRGPCTFRSRPLPTLSRSSSMVL